MSEAGKGIVAMVFACVVWGLSPLYYKQLSHIPPIEVLAHRTIWSVILFVTLLIAQRRLAELRRALRPGQGLLLICFASLMVSVNWFMFIWSVGNDHATEASLGYFLFPLVAVLLGRIVFAEALTALQWAAVGLALAAVIILTGGLGVAPWIAIGLAVTFGLYGAAKKTLAVGPVVSVTAEVTILLPIAMLVLTHAHSGGQGHFATNMQDSLLLVLSGAMTAIPLMFLSYASKRAKLSTIGLLQYINPTLQFMCAVVIFGEPFGFWHAISFPIIWGALAIYTFASLRQERASVSAA